MPDPRSVLFVVPRFHTNIYFATKALVEAGHRVAVFALRGTPVARHPDVVVKSFSSGEPLEEAFEAFSPELILIRRAKPLSHRVAWLAHARRVRTYQYDLKPVTRRRIWLRRTADRLRGWPTERVTPVPGLRSGPPAPGATLLPWPVERMGAVGKVPPRGADHRLRLLCVGKLAERRKNQVALIDALRMGGLDGRVRLTLAGTSASTVAGGSASQVRRLRLEAESDWIVIAEDVPFCDMPGLYAEHDVCILPSLNEPLGVSPLEAAAYGTVPVISTECGSAGYVMDSQNGYRIDMSRPTTVADVIRRLADDPAHLSSLSEGAQHLADGTLSPARFLQRIASL